MRHDDDCLRDNPDEWYHLHVTPTDRGWVVNEHTPDDTYYRQVTPPIGRDAAIRYAAVMAHAEYDWEVHLRVDG
jgi:hypothetical protein